MLSTDDLLLIAALARSGKPAAASTSLNVHLATVYRRLKELEQEAGAPLFQRLGGQYIPTPLGSELVRAATVVAASLAEARRQLAGGE
ncbi:LysR family transcriptional regulator, partial [Shinella sp.]